MLTFTLEIFCKREAALFIVDKNRLFKKFFECLSQNFGKYFVYLSGSLTQIFCIVFDTICLNLKLNCDLNPQNLLKTIQKSSIGNIGQK